MFEAIGEKLDVVDEAIDGAIEDTAEVLLTKATSVLFLKLMLAQQMAGCIAVGFGTDLGNGMWGVDMSWMFNLAGPELGYFLGDLSSWDANQDGHLVASEMVPKLALLDHGVLAGFADALEPTCTVLTALH